MASPRLMPHPGQPESKVSPAWLEVPIGASGAPGTYVRSRLFGTTPLTRTSAGLYTVSLAEPWNAVVSAQITIKDSAAGAGNARSGLVTAEAVTGSTPTLTIQLYDETGTAADARSGATLRIRLELQNGPRI